MFCLNEFSLSGFSVCHGCALAQSVCVVVCACVYFRVCVCVCVYADLYLRVYVDLKLRACMRVLLSCAVATLMPLIFTLLSWLCLVLRVTETVTTTTKKTTVTNRERYVSCPSERS